VASPSLMDPNFTHSVVLICRHSTEGSYGLIVNRRTERTVMDLESESSLLHDREDPLYLGGPVAGDTLQVLHRLGSGVPGGLLVMGETHLGGDPEVLRRALPQATAESEQDARFVLGCSGWGEGQLDVEIQEGAWVVCPAEERFVFDSNPESLWRRILKSLGPPYSALADLPPDPTWN
jgi:putative transcriptional regulator